MAERPARVADRLREADRVIGTGLDLDAIELFVSGARERATRDDPWRLLLDPETADTLAYEFVLATAIEELRTAERLELRRVEDDDRLPRLIATPEWVFALPGGATTPYALRSESESTATGLYDHLASRFERGRATDLDEPGRAALLESAREAFRPAFVDDLEAALAGADRLQRGDPVDVRTLLVALAARHDLMFYELHEWSETIGVAPEPTFFGPKDELVAAELVGAIKIPDGSGHPPIRLWPVDTDLRECPAADLVAFLRRKLGVD